MDALNALCGRFLLWEITWFHENEFQASCLYLYTIKSRDQIGDSLSLNAKHLKQQL